VGAEAATPPGGAEGGAVSRRALLAASAVGLPVLLAACKGVRALGTPPPPAPNIIALRSAIAAEELMLARYAATLNLLRSQPAGQPPRLEPAIQAVHVEHAAHALQLKARLIEPAGSALALSPTPTPSVSAGPAGDVTAQVGALEQAEQAASDRLISQLAGLPPSLAQLFASIAASEATHVSFLQAARRVR